MIRAFAEQGLKRYDGYFRSRGVHFIFAPIPNKSTVYFSLVPWPSQPKEFSQFIALAKSAGIDTVNILPLYDSLARNRMNVLYQSDDSHWSSQGIGVMSELLAKMM